MKLRMKDTRAISLTKYPGEDACTQVLLVAGLLTPQLAEKLGVKEGTFNEDGVPRHYETFPSPDLRIEGADVSLGDTSFRCKMIHKFKVKQPKTGGDTDISLELHMRIHFAGEEPLFAWLDNQCKKPFVFGINALQESFKFGDGDTAEDSEDAEEVEAEHAAAAPTKRAARNSPAVQ